MNIGKILKSLPNSLLLMLGLFLVMPLWSASFVDWSRVLAGSDGALATGLTIATYWAGPWLICAAILAKSFLFLPLFILECVALILKVHASATQGGGVAFMRYVLLGLTVVIGLVMANKDLLFPFMSKRLRSWRAAPRLHANLRLALTAEGHVGKAAVMMENCSATGMAIAGNAESLRALVEGAGRGGRVRLVHGSPTKGESSIAMEISWYKETAGLLQVGLRVVDEGAMDAIIDLLGARGQGFARVGAMERLWVKTGVRRAALAVWAFSLAGSFGSPACGTQPHNKRTYKGVVGLKDMLGSRKLRNVRNVSFGHGFELTAGEKSGMNLAGGSTTPQIFAGDALWPAFDCPTASATITLADQSNFYRIWDAKLDGNRLHTSLMASLGQSSSLGTVRPREAILPDPRNALGDGVEAGRWRLNAVRFRLGDQPHIKLNYELPLHGAGARTPLNFAALIHGVVVHKDDAAAFKADVAALPTEPAAAACAVSRILGKYLARGSFFFTHGDFLVGDDWRFFEAKMVENDGFSPNMGDAFQPMPDFQDAFGQDFMTSTMTSMDMPPMADTFTDSSTSSSGFMSSMDAMSMPPPMFSGSFMLSDPPARKIREPYDTPALGAGPTVSLVVVPMGFPYMRADARGNLTPATDVPPYVTFVSSTKSAKDMAGLALDAGNRTIADKSHLAFGNEPAHTCASCHEAQFSMDVDPATGKLARVKTQGATHIAFFQQDNPGGATIHGQEGRAAALSDFLLRDAGGLSVNLPGFRKESAAAGVLPKQVLLDLRKLQCLLLPEAGDQNCAFYRERFGDGPPRGDGPGTMTMTSSSFDTSSSMSGSMGSDTMTMTSSSFDTSSSMSGSMGSDTMTSSSFSTSTSSGTSSSTWSGTSTSTSWSR